ncbi:hypothetical protein Bca101_101039 [Brassica carinata]
MLVDGVLIAHKQYARPTLKYVQMVVEDVNTFLQFPWGRESFLKTIYCMKPPLDKKDPVGTLIQHLKRKTYKLQGFPLALQLVAFQAIPLLLTKIPAPLNSLTIMDINNDGDLPPHSSIYLNDFLLCEANPDPIPVIDEEVEDEHVSYMENLIAQKNEFYSLDWPGGDVSVERVEAVAPTKLSLKPKKKKGVSVEHVEAVAPTKQSLKPKKNLKPKKKKGVSVEHVETVAPTKLSLKPKKKKGKKISSARKRLFNKRLEEQVNHLSIQVANLTSLTSLFKKILSRRHGFRSARNSKFTTTCSSGKKHDQVLPPLPHENQIQGEERPRLHFFNSFLFRKLADLDKDPSSIADGKATFLRVRKWTRKVDMFGKDYIFVPVPQQENSYDCGLFLLHYLELFLAEAPQNFSPFKIHNASNFLYLNWFPPAEASSKRTLIEKLIFELLENHSREVNNEQNQSCESPVLLNNNTEIEVLSGRCTPLVDCKGSMTQTQDQGIDAYRSVNPDPKCQSPAGQTLNPDHDHLTCTPDHITFPTDHHLAPVSSTKTSYGGQSSSSSHQNISDHMQRDPPSPKNPDHTCQSIDTPAGPAANQSPKGLGFNARATVLNAFTAKATTSPGHNTGFNPKATTSNTPYIPDELVCLSDSCEARKKPKHIPTEPERILATHLLKCQTVPAKTVIGYVDNNLWELFYKTIKASKNHMEILMYTVGKHHKDMLAGVSSIFVSPWLTSYIQKKHWQFERAKHKDRFPTDFRLSSLVLLPGQKSITNVHTIYAPMIWADRHWVGLAINLPRRLVEVLDPLPELNNDRKVKRFLDPVLKMLPFVINKIAFPPLSQFTGDSPFTWSRKHALTKNSHTGDCGPVSIKFIEMHALGDPAPHMSGITDTLVDQLRKQYALDIYKSIILPTYPTAQPGSPA